MAKVSTKGRINWRGDGKNNISFHRPCIWIRMSYRRYHYMYLITQLFVYHSFIMFYCYRHFSIIIIILEETGPAAVKVGCGTSNVWNFSHRHFHGLDRFRCIVTSPSPAWPLSLAQRLEHACFYSFIVRMMSAATTHRLTRPYSKASRFGGETVLEHVFA